MSTRVGVFDWVQNRTPWWVILLVGIASLVLGFLLLTSPGITTVTLVQFLGVYWFIAGIFSIIEIFINSRSWGWKLLMGVIGILAGLTVLQHPITSAIVVPSLVVFFVAFLGIFYGVISIVRAFTDRSLGLGILGVLSILLGVIILGEPMLAVLSLPFLVGTLAIVGGVAEIFEAFRVRGREHEIERVPVPGTQTYGGQIPVTGPEREGDSEEESDRPQAG